MAGRPRWEVQRAEQPRCLGDIRDDLLAVPGVIAEGNHIRPRGEQRAGHVRRKAEAVRGVLRVDDRKVDAQIPTQTRQPRGHRIPAGAADHVAQKKYPQVSPPHRMMPFSVATASSRMS